MRQLNFVLLKQLTMNTLKFTTNIKCTGCVEKAAPFLNEAAGAGNWEVDLKAPEKTLVVKAGNALDPSGILKAMDLAGYKASLQN